MENYVKESIKSEIGALENFTNRKSSQILFEYRESNKKHYSYKEEKALLEGIKTGNIESVGNIKVLPRTKDGTIEYKRRLKNISIIAATLATRAAIEGGLQEDLAYSLNETYTTIIEMTDEEEKLLTIQKFCFTDLAKRVSELDNIKYSPAIKKCINYIQYNIYDKISLEDLSGLTGLSTRQLGRKFKDELTMTVVEYIQYEKVRTAKRLLKFSEHSILEISDCLDFCSQSYFIEVFKKHTKITPTQYRMKYDNFEID